MDTREYQNEYRRTRYRADPEYRARILRINRRSRLKASLLKKYKEGAPRVTLRTLAAILGMSPDQLRAAEKRGEVSVPRKEGFPWITMKEALDLFEQFSKDEKKNATASA